MEYDIFGDLPQRFAREARILSTQSLEQALKSDMAGDVLGRKIGIEESDNFYKAQLEYPKVFSQVLTILRESGLPFPEQVIRNWHMDMAQRYLSEEPEFALEPCEKDAPLPRFRSILISMLGLPQEEIESLIKEKRDTSKDPTFLQERAFYALCEINEEGTDYLNTKQWQVATDMYPLEVAEAINSGGNAEEVQHAIREIGRAGSSNVRSAREGYIAKLERALTSDESLPPHLTDDIQFLHSRYGGANLEAVKSMMRRDMPFGTVRAMMQIPDNQIIEKFE